MELAVLMDKVAVKKHSLLVVGDLNVWIEVQQSQVSKGLLEIMHSFVLSQHVTERTHTFGHTLDHIYFNEFESTKNHKMLDDTYGLSADHFPILVNIPQLQMKTTHSKSRYRNIKNIYINILREELEQSYLSIDTASLTFEESYNRYYKLSMNVMNKHASLKTYIKKSHEPAWMDKEYKDSRKQRRNMKESGEKIRHT